MFKFSIITTCYNAEKYIKETIESVIQQTEFLNSKCELEYIIVDELKITQILLFNTIVNYAHK